MGLDHTVKVIELGSNIKSIGAFFENISSYIYVNILTQW